MTLPIKYQVMEVKSFKKALLKLAKKYPSSIDKTEDLFEELEKGNLLGDDIPGLRLKGNKVFKTRLENPDAKKGKSKGFRVIWYLVTTDKEIYPLTIYSKSDQEDIANKQLMQLIRLSIRRKM